MIFTTTDPYFEWDGTYQNEDAPVGVYVYRCVVTDGTNRIKEYTGSITLLR